MQFLYPSFLWAMLALAIPIIIHLFYFRRFKKVYFTNVKLLAEIKEETSNSNKLKHLLVLLSRCLALASLVFAFAQPFIPKGDTIKTGNSQVSVFVDNSFSMTTDRQGIPLLDIAKQRARAIINAYSEEDRFQVLTHDLEGKHLRLLSKEDALAMVEEIVPTANVQEIEKILNRQKQTLTNPSDNKISYIISDFQKSIASELATYRDTTMEVNLLPLQTNSPKNIGIDSAWFMGPMPFFNQNNKLVIRTTNYSPTDAEQIKLSYKADGQDKPVGIIDIPAGGSRTDTVTVTITKAGYQQATISVTDFPVQFDDDYYISYFVPDTISTLFVHESAANKYIDALFRGVKYFQLTNQSVNQLQFQKFKDFNLIILSDLTQITSGLASELNKYINGGGKVLVFPGANANINTYNDFFNSMGAGRFNSINKTKKEVASLNTKSFVFSDVYNNLTSNLRLPVTNVSFDKAANTSRLEEVLITYRDGSSYLSSYRHGDGQLFVCSAPLDNTSNDLVLNAEVFVPMIYKIALATPVQKPLSYTISNKIVIQTLNKRTSGDFAYKMKGEKEFIPAQFPSGNKVSLDLANNVTKAGYFDLILDDNIVDRLAFNYDRRESAMDIYTDSGLGELTGQNAKISILDEALQANVSSTVTEKDKGVVLWKWFLIFALIFLGIEVLLLKFIFKK